jgi:hypothetical protein
MGNPVTSCENAVFTSCQIFKNREMIEAFRSKWLGEGGKLMV